jgi:hypothetical protein
MLTETRENTVLRDLHHATVHRSFETTYEPRSIALVISTPFILMSGPTISLLPGASSVGAADFDYGWSVACFTGYP